MSEFQVRIRRIKEIRPHPNADRLEICQVEGYQCVVKKGQYHEGELVAYIPEQSVVPEILLVGEGLWKDGKGLLSGKDGNVVKAVRLRGEISQGLLYKMSTHDWQLGDEVSKALGITKYEQPIPDELKGEVEQVDILLKYEIENVKTYPDVLKPGEPVHIGEKLHGMASFIVFDKKGNHYISSKGLIAKGLFFKRECTNVYIRAIEPYISTLASFVSTDAEYTVFVGEVFGKGVQDLSYGLDKPEFRLFDIAVMKKGLWEFLPRPIAYRTAEQRGINTVPVLYEGPWSLSILDEYVDGTSSVLCPSQIREGVVICSSNNRNHSSVGRVILKAVSVDYLLRKNGTEYS